jgi:hypothetical protein
MYSATAITATPDTRISIESPHSTSVIVKDVETTDIPVHKLLELLKINDVALDGRISFLWWSWVGWVRHDGRSTRVLSSIGQSKGSSKLRTDERFRDICCLNIFNNYRRVADPTNPTPPEKTDAAIQCDIIDFQQFQKFMDMMDVFKN